MNECLVDVKQRIPPEFMKKYSCLESHFLEFDLFEKNKTKQNKK